MGQLLLVRHGQASWGNEDYDVLSPLGWEQSRMLGTALGERGLSPEVVVQGGMRRHRETALGVFHCRHFGAHVALTPPRAAPPGPGRAAP